MRAERHRLSGGSLEAREPSRGRNNDDHERFRVGAVVFGVNEDHTTRVTIAGASRPLQLDVVGYLADGRRVAIQYDGSFWHMSDVARRPDVIQTSRLLAAGFLVVRVRELTAHYQLPELDLQDFRLLQVGFEHTLDAKRVHKAVSEIEQWLGGVVSRSSYERVPG